jgi:hypothetical protein
MEHSMKPVFAAWVAVALGLCCLVAPAQAAPPTVTPSPGYDARLQEQRAAATVPAPAPRSVRPPHRSRRLHGASR